MICPFRAVLLLASLAAAARAETADWPMWRHDAQRSGVTDQTLSTGLRPAWIRKQPAQRTAWPASQYKLQFDAGYEPIVVGQRLFVGSTVDDSIAAYSVETGEELWRVLTDGPVRFAPAAWNERLFVAGDDGWLYSLEQSSGALVWKVRIGPQQRPIIGNDRLISTWPVRGAPVVADDTVYVTAGIWPSMGIFVQAVDCSSGQVQWNSSRVSSLYVTHPHRADSFGALSPQGPLAVSGDDLLVPGGRTLPAVFDRRTGELRHFDFGDKGSGGWGTLAAGKFYVTDNELCLREDGVSVTKLPADLFDGRRYVGIIGRDVAVTPYSEVMQRSSEVDRRGRKVVKVKLETSTTRFTPQYPGKVQLVAGGLVYLAGDGVLSAYPVDSRGDAATPVAAAWAAPIDGEVTSMLAAAERLFAATQDGAIHCYSADSAGTPTLHEPTVKPWDVPGGGRHSDVAAMIATAPLAGGYAVVVGAEPALVQPLVAQSEFRLVVLDEDPEAVDALRRHAAGAGLYGTRLSAHAAPLSEFRLPPYLADLFVMNRPPADVELNDVFGTLRPYGGTAFLRTTASDHERVRIACSDVKRFPNANLTRSGEWTILRRVGPLPDSGSWTHQYGDASNSVVSLEGQVKAPLAVLWFGGPPNDKVLPRHGHGPTPQVAGGRLFIEGADMLRCVDVYTGRLVWERDFPGLGAFYDNTAHQPGAGEIGSNYVSLEDHVYVIHRGALLELDAATGGTTRAFTLNDGAPATEWGWLAVEGETLLATAAPVEVEGVRPFAAPTIPKGMQALVAPHSRWRFQTGVEEESWTAADFDDSQWIEGDSGFGFGVAGLRTSLADMRGKSAVARLRIAFDVADVASIRSLQLMANYDDAFVAHLNGREVLRGSFRGGNGSPWEVRSHNPAGYETFDVADFGELLVEGRNVLSIEAHNAEADDEDFAIDAYLLASRPLDQDNSPAVADLLSPVTYSSASRVLAAFNRHSGDLLWQRPAKFSYRHNGICAGGGRVYCIDGLSEQKLAIMRRRGVPADFKPELLALDLHSGDEVWSTDEHVFGTFLNYSREHDVVLQGGSAARDRARDEANTGLIAYRGATGDVLWKNVGLQHAGPCLLLRDRIITNGDGGFELHLLTGETTGWRYSRMYGCNTAVGCLNMLTFRSGAAGFFDLASQSGTGNLGGFRSSCTSNLIPADGVLSAPDYTRTCVCAYQLQTSLAFVHEPQAESWTFNDPNVTPVPEESIGINLGAPGDRRDAGGVMWFDFPSQGGPSPPLDVRVEPSDVRWFSSHSAVLPPGDHNWIGASGVAGARQLTWTLGAQSGRTATIRLVFADPDRLAPGERVFSVAVQGKVVLPDFDVAAAASAPGATVVRDIPGVLLAEALTVELTPATLSGNNGTILCGIGVIDE